MQIQTKKHFSLLIPDGESPQALGVLRCLAQEKKVRVYILSDNPWASVRFSSYTSRFFSYRNDNANEGKLNAINKIVKEAGVDIILPVG